MADAQDDRHTPDEEAPAPGDGPAQEGEEAVLTMATDAPGSTPRGPEPDAYSDAAVESSAGRDQLGLGNLQRMLDVPLGVTVELGRTQMQLADVLKLQPGSVVEIDRLPGEPIDLFINGSLFARGEVVVINETFGYRITELVQRAPGRTGTELEGA